MPTRHASAMADRRIDTGLTTTMPASGGGADSARQVSNLLDRSVGRLLDRNVGRTTRMRIVF